MSESAAAGTGDAGDAGTGGEAQGDLGLGGAGGGGGGQSWRTGLPADIQGHPALQDFADVPALAKSYLSTKELVGSKGVRLPKEGDEADLARFYGDLGRPETPTDYDLGDFAPPEGMPWDENWQSEMLGKLHGAGLTNVQVNQIIRDYAATQRDGYVQLLETIEKGKQDSIQALKTKLGTKFDGALDLGNRAFKDVMKDEGERSSVTQIVLQDGTLLGNHPAFVGLLMKMGDGYKEHGLLGDKTGTSFSKSPDEAKVAIAELEKNPAYRNADDSEHTIMVARMDDLYKQAYPEPEGASL